MRLSKSLNGARSDVDILVDYLSADTDLKLKILIGFGGGSLEKFKRIYESIFPNDNLNQIKTQVEIRRKVAQILLNPDEHIAQVPQFIRQGFRLPQNWKRLLEDETYLQTVASQKMSQAQYSVSVGVALEDKVREMVEKMGYRREKGRVGIVDDKEVDIVIPSLEAPQVLIMSSYQLTTSSSQTSKANEQRRMYSKLREHNESRAELKKPDIKFVNVIDGGGWLARNSDLRVMWAGCDYCLAHSQLAQLEDILKFAF